MNCRPRRLFQEIGQRIGINWFKQPRARMILVPEDGPERIEANISDLLIDLGQQVFPAEGWRRQ